MKKYLPYGFALVSFVLGVLAYKTYPDTYTIHWNAAGEADGFAQKGISIFFFPLLQLGLVLLMQWIPKFDPKATNISKFMPAYDSFIGAFSGFFSYLFVAMYLWNTGNVSNFSLLMIPGFSIFTWFLADLVSQAKMNYMIGIRTPWTLADERIWNKTHELGGKILRIGAGVSLLGLLTPTYGIFIYLGSLILPMVYLVWFSYTEYKKMKKA